MTVPSPIAFVIPTATEFLPFMALIPGLRAVDRHGPWQVHEGALAGRQLVFITSGAGPVNAAAATERLVVAYGPTAVLHGGSAGAHNPALLPGDLVLGARYVIAISRVEREARLARGMQPTLIRFRRRGERFHPHFLEADPRLLALAQRVASETLPTLGPWPSVGWPVEIPPRAAIAVSGTLASADVWTTDPASIRALREDAGAECEDMESAYVAQVCAMHELPFLAVRVISNNEAHYALRPEELEPAIGAAGLRAAAVLASVAAAW